MSTLQEQLQHLNVLARGFRRQPVHTFPINEGAHQEEIIDQLTQPGILRPTEGKAQLHAGVAGCFNFDMAVAAKSDGIILMDNNRNQIDFWRSIVPLIVASPTTADFRAAFVARIKDGDHFRLMDSNCSRTVPLRFRDVFKDQTPVPEDFFEDQGWLDVPQMYAHIHRLAKEGAIAAVLIDITDAAQCRKLKQAISMLDIDGRNAELATLYASNVYDLQQMHPLQGLAVFVGKIRGLSTHVTPEKLEEVLVNALCNGKGPKEDPQWHRRKAAIHTSIEPLHDVFTGHAVVSGIEDVEPALRGETNVELCLDAFRRWAKRYQDVSVQQIYHQLFDHPKLSDEVLVAAGLIGPDAGQLMYHKSFTPKAAVSYTPLREMAGEHTRIYCTSIRRTRPLVVFEGPESPAASWRDQLRAEGAKGMQTLRVDDQIVGR